MSISLGVSGIFFFQLSSISSQGGGRVQNEVISIARSNVLTGIATHK